MSNEISSFRQSGNKLNMFNLFRLCRKDEILFDIVAETKTATMSKNRSTCSIRQCCFDIVAGIDGALQTAGASYMTKVCNSRTLAALQQVTVAVLNKHFCYYITVLHFV